MPAPSSQRGLVAWVRTNLFATVTDSILSVIAILVLVYFLPPLLNWLFFSAQWTGSDRTVCATIAQGGIQPEGWAGACWAFVGSKFEQFMFNVYPQDERWRVILCAIFLAVLLVPFLMPKAPYKGLNAVLLFIVLPIVGYFLLVGGYFGLRYVPTRDWGGFMVTIILSYVGIVFSLPMGVILALGRRSTLPVVKALCVVFIEMVRGVPLITVLFMATKMLPLFMPNGLKIDDFLCVLIGVALFASAYMAEVIRGGLQAMPKGQYEGAIRSASATGQKMRLDHPAAGAEAGHSRHRQHLHRPLQGHEPGLHRRHVRPARRDPPQLLRCQLDHAADADDRAGLCRLRVLAVLLRHVALLDLHGTPARHRSPQVRKRGTVDGHRKRGERRGDRGRRQQDCRSRRPMSPSRSSTCTNGTATFTCSRTST